MIQSSIMRSAGIMFIILICSSFTAGCNQLPPLPGIHILTNTPDPIIGQWIGGEPPASDRHVIFYENQTFLSTTFFIRRGEETTTGNWTKIQPGLYSTRSVTGEITEWGYDSFDDSIYISGLPQMKYHRYKG
jgi:hypothetical protein